ncbi:ABC transporter permease [Nocardioides albus]|uniref:Peptide/nickel transport system permease protein n=1 Tax=Nocardioides albus TaxID=1841 RepID=A0A7W5F892_9ACTN|nr:ABC transporter permease [Nocardioides albus]MBB3088989.1 peptide/nickel transport system permease protein [Nocardioides albus]GGU14981.1 glutathione ABC transporter permease GsiD [Nocardioides albus]
MSAISLPTKATTRARVRRKKAWTPGSIIAAAVVVAMVLIGLLAPWLAPHDPLQTNSANTLAGPSAAHWLGTDQVGRDVLSRAMFGATAAFRGTAVAVLTMLAIGIPWGLAAGYVGGVADEISMRVADAFLSIPGLVLAVAITGVVGSGLTMSMIAVGVIFSPSIAMLLRSNIIPIRRSNYLRAARALGVSDLRAAVRHVLPNAFGPVLVQVCGLASLCLIVQAALGFLGLGITPPNPSWGGDLADVYLFFTQAPFATVIPGLLIATAAFSISRIGDAIRAGLDVG